MNHFIYLLFDMPQKRTEHFSLSSLTTRLLIANSAWFSFILGWMIIFNVHISLLKIILLGVSTGLIALITIAIKSMVFHFFASLNGEENKTTSIFLKMLTCFTPLYLWLPFSFILKNSKSGYIFVAAILLLGSASLKGYELIKNEYPESASKLNWIILAPSILFFVLLFAITLLFISFKLN